MRFLTREQLSEFLPAEEVSFRSPLPTQIVSSDEYLPAPQTLQQRQAEARNMPGSKTCAGGAFLGRGPSNLRHGYVARRAAG